MSQTVIVRKNGPNANLLVRFVWWLLIGWWASGIVVGIAWFAQSTNRIHLSGMGPQGSSGSSTATELQVRHPRCIHRPSPSSGPAAGATSSPLHLFTVGDKQ